MKLLDPAKNYISFLFPHLPIFMSTLGGAFYPKSYNLKQKNTLIWLMFVEIWFTFVNESAWFKQFVSLP